MGHNMGRRTSSSIGSKFGISRGDDDDVFGQVEEHEEGKRTRK